MARFTTKFLSFVFVFVCVCAIGVIFNNVQTAFGEETLSDEHPYFLDQEYEIKTLSYDPADYKLFNEEVTNVTGIEYDEVDYKCGDAINYYMGSLEQLNKALDAREVNLYNNVYYCKLEVLGFELGVLMDTAMRSQIRFTGKSAMENSLNVHLLRESYQEKINSFKFKMDNIKLKLKRQEYQANEFVQTVYDIENVMFYEMDQYGAIWNVADKVDLANQQLAKLSPSQVAYASYAPYARLNPNFGNDDVVLQIGYYTELLNTVRDELNLEFDSFVGKISNIVTLEDNKAVIDAYNYYLQLSDVKKDSLNNDSISKLMIAKDIVEKSYAKVSRFTLLVNRLSPSNTSFTRTVFNELGQLSEVERSFAASAINAFANFLQKNPLC